MHYDWADFFGVASLSLNHPPSQPRRLTHPPPSTMDCLKCAMFARQRCDSWLMACGVMLIGDGVRYTLLTRKRTPLGPFGRPMPKVSGGVLRGRGVFLWAKTPVLSVGEEDMPKPRGVFLWARYPCAVCGKGRCRVSRVCAANVRGALTEAPRLSEAPTFRGSP